MIRSAFKLNPKRMLQESTTSTAAASLSLSSRRKRKHIDVEFEGKNATKQAEKKETTANIDSKNKLRFSQIEKITAFMNKNVSDWAQVVPKGEGKAYRFDILVSLMLSSQTRDKTLEAACANLRAKLNGGLTVESIRKVDEETLASIIKPVRFYAKKSVYLKKTADILASKYKGDIPNTLEGLLDLPGVGPKMAYLAMLHAWNNCVGIGVDVHVHRVSNRLGFVNTNKPEDTRKELEEWVPRSQWPTIDILLVRFGQAHCLPVGPKCSTCVVNDTCPSANLNLAKDENKKTKKKAKRKAAEKDEDDDDEDYEQ